MHCQLFVEFSAFEGGMDIEILRPSGERQLAKHVVRCLLGQWNPRSAELIEYGDGLLPGFHHGLGELGHAGAGRAVVVVFFGGVGAGEQLAQAGLPPAFDADDVCGHPLMCVAITGITDGCHDGVAAGAEALSELIRRQAPHGALKDEPSYEVQKMRTQCHGATFH